MGVSFTIVDVPSDRATLDAGFRRSAAHATDLLAVAGYLLQQAKVPVWFLSGGSSLISAVSVMDKADLEVPLGLIGVTPHSFGDNALTDAELASVRRPALVINHGSDTCPCCPPEGTELMVTKVVNAPAVEHVVLFGGNEGASACDDVAGPHGLGGLHSVLTSTTVGWIRAHNWLLGNYQGLWWVADGAESGWGINFAHQGNVIFATWFTYDLTGRAWWLSMTANKIAGGIYSGTLYEAHGPPFSAVPFASSAVTLAPVGTGTLAFANANSVSFQYTVNGVTQTKVITRQTFGQLPTCMWGARANLALATNYQDLWWAAPAGSESGWGINLTQQGDTIFATWFTYDTDRAPLWLSVTAQKSAAGVYTGTLYRTRGPAFSATPFNASQVTPTAAGSATFTFDDGNNARFAYTVNDVSQVKPITRQVFEVPGTACQ